MSASGFSLLRTRRFAPLFAMQFLSAFNDNLFRTAMLFLIAYHIVPGDIAAAGTWSVVAGGVFVLPYFIFSSLAGELADRVDKARLARSLRAIDVVIMCGAAAALHFASLAGLLLMLFATGVRGVFFGPLKYSILPQHLSRDELLAGTGLMQASGFLAILAGQIAASLLPYEVTALALMLIAVAALLTACLIPPASASHPGLPLELNLVAGMAKLIAATTESRALFGAILGISWFYALGAVFTSQFPSLVANVIGATEDVGALLLGAFTIGIAAGGIGVAMLLKGRISARYVPISAVVLSIFTIDVWMISSAFSPGPQRMLLSEFVRDPDSWRLLFDLFGVAASAAVFAVPLYAVLQTAGQAERRARDVAANNLANAAAVVVAATLAGCMFALGAGIPALFLALSVATLGVALVAWRNTRSPEEHPRPRRA